MCPMILFNQSIPITRYKFKKSNTKSPQQQTTYRTVYYPSDTKDSRDFIKTSCAPDKEQKSYERKQKRDDLREPGTGARVGPGAGATINQDLDLIKSCIEVTRVAARRAAVPDKDGADKGWREKDDAGFVARGIMTIRQLLLRRHRPESVGYSTGVY